MAKALGYARPNDAISQHCRYTAKHRVPHPQSPDKEIEMIFIPEGKDQTLACFEDEERLKLWNDTGYMQLAKYLKK